MRTLTWAPVSAHVEPHGTPPQPMLEPMGFREKGTRLPRFAIRYLTGAHGNPTWAPTEEPYECGSPGIYRILISRAVK